MRKKTVLLYFKENSLSNSRLGISVSKKFGNAVRRNCFKRHVREIFRKSTFKFSGFDVLVVSNNRYFQKNIPMSDKQINNLISDLESAFVKITTAE